MDRDAARRHARSAALVAHLLRGQFFSYPLKAGEALCKLGIFESTRCVLSYFKARAVPGQEPAGASRTG